MRVVIQRVLRAEVSVANQRINEINRGFLLLVGIHAEDDEQTVEKLAEKCAGLRIFEDEQGKMNLSLSDVGGEVLSISQFTLYADARKGRRPSFDQAARPQKAEPLYKRFNALLREKGLIVKPGVFGADMQVSLINDGPVTIILDSEELKESRRAAGKITHGQ